MATLRPPLFIIGTERSGSNLVRVILDSHSCICVPHPPHVLNLLGGIERRDGPPDLERMARSIDRLLRNHIHPWSFALDLPRMVEAARPPDLYGLVAAMYEQAAAAEGKARWGCKSTFMIHHVHRILDRDPDARLVWLVRDPRDVAASSKRSVFNPYHPVQTARLWAEQQALGLELEERLPDSAMLRLRYEDLVRSAESELRRLCDFLGEDFEPGMLRFFERDEARRGAAMSESWRNTARPILVSNTGKHREELTTTENAWVEAIAAEAMTALGYAPEQEARPAPSGLSGELGLRALDLGLRLRGELRSALRDRNRGRRLRRAAVVRWLNLRAR